jgi:hypothetical protein
MVFFLHRDRPAVDVKRMAVLLHRLHDAFEGIREMLAELNRYLKDKELPRSRLLRVPIECGRDARRHDRARP